MGDLLPAVCLSLGRRDVPDGLEQSGVVEAEHPLQGGHFHELSGFAGVTAADGACDVSADAVGNSALLQPARCLFIYREKTVQSSIATSGQYPQGLSALFSDRLPQSRRNKTPRKWLHGPKNRKDLPLISKATGLRFHWRRGCLPLKHLKQFQLTTQNNVIAWFPRKYLSQPVLPDNVRF